MPPDNETDDLLSHLWEVMQQVLHPLQVSIPDSIMDALPLQHGPLYLPLPGERLLLLLFTCCQCRLFEKKKREKSQEKSFILSKPTESNASRPKEYCSLKY